MAYQSDNFLDHMSIESLEQLRKRNSAWRLLASPQAAFVSAFLYKAFIAENRREISENELIGILDNFIYKINQDRDEQLVSRFGSDYLEEWANDNHGWLRKFYPSGQDEPYFDLTSLAQKAIEWLLSLKQQAFIGTESRLITVFDLLRQIVERSETDPELRIQELERRKKEIDNEISLAKEGKFSLLDDTQIKERFWQAIMMARDILADFRAVEQNFRELDREMRERIATWSGGKGELLSEFFKEQDGITLSEQGKSFSSFWSFLMSSSYQDTFQETLQRVLNLKPIQELSISRSVNHIQYDWVNAGSHVQEMVAMLSQQLRRYVDESYLDEERRINQIMREIEGNAIKVRNNPPDSWLIEMDGIKPVINLPMDRPIYTVPQRPTITDDTGDISDDDVSTDELYSMVYVDKDVLRLQIWSLLQSRDSISLSQVVERYPITLGLSELLAYLSIAAENEYSKYTSDIEPIVWKDENGKKWVSKMIKIIFCRS